MSLSDFPYHLILLVKEDKASNRSFLLVVDVDSLDLIWYPIWHHMCEVLPNTLIPLLSLGPIAENEVEQDIGAVLVLVFKPDKTVWASISNHFFKLCLRGKFEHYNALRIFANCLSQLGGLSN